MPNNKKITFEEKHNGKRIRTNKSKGNGCDTEVLDKIDHLLEGYMNKHNKALVVRGDLRYPDEYKEVDDNDDFSKTMSTTSKYFRRKGCDPAYFAVRERKEGKHHHYHVAFICDGNKIKSSKRVLGKIEECWCNTLGIERNRNGEVKKGYVHYCNKSEKGLKQPNSYEIRRHDDDYETVFENCYERLSYMAKENTKGDAPPRKREIFFSRIPKK